jgi:hypothetical protein
MHRDPAEKVAEHLEFHLWICDQSSAPVNQTALSPDQAEGKATRDFSGSTSTPSV